MLFKYSQRIYKLQMLYYDYSEWYLVHFFIFLRVGNIFLDLRLGHNVYLTMRNQPTTTHISSFLVSCFPWSSLKTPRFSRKKLDMNLESEHFHNLDNKVSQASDSVRIIVSSKSSINQRFQLWFNTHHSNL